MEHRCYKNGKQLPDLNFTNVCEKTGQYIIIYNERLVGVSYPDDYSKDNVYMELCEVIVDGMIFDVLFL